MSKEINENIKQDLEEIGKNLNLIYSHFNKVINFYFDFGWFFDYDLPLKRNIYKIFKDENYLLDKFMIEYFTENISEIEKILIDRFQDRSIIIRKAFEAHRNHNYEMSIPLLIIQSDGIFRDITNKELFSKKESLRAEILFKNLDKRRINTINKIALSVFRKYNQLSASFLNYKEYPFMLHRNLILHGYQNDYATEINSHKAISLINFVGKVVYDFQIIKQ